MTPRFLLSRRGRPVSNLQGVIGIKLLGTALTLVMLGFAGAPAPVSAQPLNTGVTPGDSVWLSPEPEVDIPDLFAQRSAEVGAKYVRVDVAPRLRAEARAETLENPLSEAVDTRAERRNPATYDWDFTLESIDAYRSRGLIPVLEITDIPPLRQIGLGKNPSCRSGVSPCPVTASDIQDIAIAAARRFSGSNPARPAVRHWEYGNLYPTVDGRTGLRLNVTVAQARKQLNAFANGIHSVRSANRVIAEYVSKLDFSSTDRGAYPARRLLCLRPKGAIRPVKGCKGQLKVDIWRAPVSTVGSPTWVPRNSPAVLVPMRLKQVRKALDVATRTGHLRSKTKRAELWASGLSWEVNPPNPYGVSQGTQARWNAEAMQIAWRAGATTVLIDRLVDSYRPSAVSGGRWDFDELPWSVSFEDGLFQRGPFPSGDGKRLSSQAFRFPFVARLAKGRVHFWGRTPNAKRSALQLVLHRKDGTQMSLRRIRAAGNGIFRGSFPLKTARRNDSVQARVVPEGEASLPFGLWRTPVRRLHRPFEE